MKPITDHLSPLFQQLNAVEEVKLLADHHAKKSMDLDLAVQANGGKEDHTRLPSRELAPLKASSLEFLQRKTAEAASKKDVQPTKVLQLSFDKWDEERRAVPNHLIRSGLFTTRSSSNRLNLKSETVASLSTAKILYTGEELRQDDLSVWMALFTLGRAKSLGDPIYFTAYQMLKDMKWSMHKVNYERLRASIERLKHTTMKITTKNERSGYAGSLIRDYKFDAVDDENNACFSVRLEPTIASLFLFEETTLVEWVQRLQIGSKASLTLWLHIFYSSHREPIPYSIKKIWELCKSEEKKHSNFRARVRVSMQKLVDIGFLSSFTIIGDILSVKRTAYVPAVPSEKLMALG